MVEVVRFVAVFFLILALISVVLVYFLMQPSFAAASKADNREAFAVNELEDTVKTLVEDFHPRDGAHPDNMKRCAAYIKQQFMLSTERVEYQSYILGQDKYRNIIASFGPQDGARIIVGAHYDSAGPTPGADDNASGVAGLIALAQKLTNHELPYRIDLVAYALEEPPYFKTDQMGSARHAFKMRDEQVDVKLMISLEMIAFYSDEPDSQAFPIPLLKLLYPDQGNFIAVVGLLSQGGITKKVKSLMQRATDMEVYSINAPRVIPGIDFSDHLNYWNEGFPAVMITDTAFYRNHHYHMATDTPEKLDYEKMADVLSGVLNVLVNFKS